jgi:dihydrofolate reductase
MLVGLWAEDKNQLIGKDNTLPWHLSDDLKRFKQLTQGNIIVMGRKTYEGMGSRALPNRVNIVLTHDENYDGGKAMVMHSVSEILQFAEKNKEKMTTYIIGGAGVFKSFENRLDKLLITKINEEFEGDAWFPKDFDRSVFKLVKKRVGPKDEKSPFDYTYETYIRTQSPEQSVRKRKSGGIRHGRRR